MDEIREDKVSSGESQNKSPISRFNRWLRSFNNRHGDAVQKREQISQPITGIANTLEEGLRNKENPIRSPEVKGVSAILDTNEKVPVGFFEAIKEKNPDGYIVGVGVGNVFSLLNCFQEENTPKGMVLVDVNPKVVVVGKLLVDSLKHSETPSDFSNSFFRLPTDKLQEHIREIIEREENADLKQRLENVPQKDWEKVIGDIQGWASMDEEYARSLLEKGNYEGVVTILSKFNVLREMARLDNIAVIYSDFTNPALIDSVRDLPGFKGSRNIIYMSNIVDHILRIRGHQAEDVSKMDSLRAYEKSSKKSIFVDTLQHSLHYFLRARYTMPTYSEQDFEFVSHRDRNKIPDGLIFPDEK